MARVSVLKECILLCCEAKITPMLWGYHGLGKSSIYQQIAESNGWGFVNRRLADGEAPDLKGLPDKKKSFNGKMYTTYLAPEDMPIGDMTDDQIMAELRKVVNFDSNGRPIIKSLQDERRYNECLSELQPHFERGILLLDEINRAQDDVLQAAFQLVLDRRVGQYVIPPGWSVAAAGNFNNGYQTNGFTDEAFLDRFCHLTFPRGEDTLEDWVSYMTDNYGDDASEVIEFASQNVDHLDGRKSGDLGFTIAPSRRSWASVVRVDKIFREKKFSTASRVTTLGGLIGLDLASSYINYSCPVKPKDILEKGVESLQKKLDNLDRNQISGLMWGLVSFCKPKVNSDRKIADSCLDFTEWLINSKRHTGNRDIGVAFLRSLVNNEKTEGAAAFITNPELVKMMLKHVKGEQRAEFGFVEALNARPELQELVKNVAWGNVAS